jgi:hypothetical protein
VATLGFGRQRCSRTVPATTYPEARTGEVGHGSLFGETFKSFHPILIFQLNRNSSETPIRSRSIDWIDEEYPAAEIDPAGVTVHWAVCFAVLSMATALVLRRRLRVRF